MARKPQLPEQLVKDLLARPTFSDTESLVFQPNFHEKRVKMVSGAQLMHSDLSVDHTMVVENNLYGMGPDSKRTFLHLGALSNDPLLVCEIIRIGAAIDLPDAHGATALWMAAEAFAKVAFVMPLFVNLSPPPKDPRKRLAFIIRTLVEQHANVNIVHRGITPLHLACQAQDWDLINLLLEHGANPTTPSTISTVQLLLKPSDQKRFNKLAKELSGKPRPSRPCPCWSGQLLADCHDREEKPYPPAFICRCGSGKTYAKCCTKRQGMAYLEKWDPEGEFLMPVVGTLLPEAHAPGTGAIMEKSLKWLAEAQGSGSGGMVSAEELKALQGALADNMAQRNVIDVAYAFAMKQVDFNPRPCGNSVSRARCLEFQKEWNEAIDKYISLGSDSRPPEEIEYAAKIGSSCGALYRTCEGKNCSKTESRDVPKLDKCSKCKMSVYCGRACQASAWPSHKAICNTPDQLEQALPSQIAMFEMMGGIAEMIGGIVESISPSRFRKHDK